MGQAQLIRTALLALALAPSAARADASVQPAGPGKLTFAGTAVDLDTHQVGQTLAGAQCPQVEWPLSGEGERKTADSFRAAVAARDVYPKAMTARHVLFGTFWGRKDGAGAVVDRASGKVVWRGGESIAMVEDKAGALEAVVVIEHGGKTLALYGGDGKLRGRVPGESYGDAADALLDGDQVVIALYEAISCSTSLIALDRATGAVRWKADVAQISVGHSKYAHRARIALYGRQVVLRDVQSGGCSLQTFDRATGKRLLTVTKQGW